MYNFVDVNQTSESVVLPSEALKINGEYIENKISGYRTLNVTGREALSPEIESFTTGIRDGSRLKNKRFPERIIGVTYQIIADSNESFREAYNQLGMILNVEEAELIFNDEPDRYYVGTPCGIDEVEPGRNAVVGKFEILCTDPFKYSVIEYEAEPIVGENGVYIDYNGTYKSYPVLEADFYSETEVADDGETSKTLTGNGECGYVAFFTEREKIIQLGDPEEVDAESFPKSQTLINQKFMKSSAWGKTAKGLWTINNGYVLSDNIVQEGALAMAMASGTVEDNPTTGTLLTAKSTSGAPAINYTVKAKSSQRTTNSVKVDITITTSLENTGSYFGNGYGLIASVYIGGSWREVTLKKTTDYWKGTSGHTANLSVTVSGLTSSQTSISGIKFKVGRSDSNGNAGILEETACKAFTISAYTTKSDGTYYLAPSNFGSTTNKWHGPSIRRDFKADEAGEVGAANFTLTYKQKMCISEGSAGSKEYGAFIVNLADANGNSIAGIKIAKRDAGKAADLEFYVAGKKVNTTDIDIHSGNDFFGTTEEDAKASTITKAGNKITFAVGSYKRQYTDNSLKDTKATSVTFMFYKHSSRNVLAYNGLYWAKFVKNNCTTSRDIPNKFSANDVLTADCKTGEIHLNGVLSPELGALGNDWEEFYLVPGFNQIGIAYSDWVKSGYEPSMKVRYREVFL
jgi:predicted phage tail component-like protein